MAFTGGQKIALAGVVLSLMVLALGGFSPYWEQIDVSGASLGMGLWFECGQIEGEGHCQYLDTSGLTDEYAGRFWVSRISSLFAFFLTLATSIAGLSHMRSPSEVRTVGLGVATFLGGVTGFISVGTFASFFDIVQDVDPTELHFGWSFYLFTTGSVICVLSSFLFCVASTGIGSTPGVIYNSMSNPASVVISNSSNSQQAMSFGSPLYPYPQNVGPYQHNAKFQEAYPSSGAYLNSY